MKTRNGPRKLTETELAAASGGVHKGPPGPAGGPDGGPQWEPPPEKKYYKKMLYL